MDFNYKKYSLEKLQEWVHDALSSGEASPHEIYSAIREAVREDYYYYKDHSSRAYGLLELLSGHRPVKDATDEDTKEQYIYTEDKIRSCDKDDSSPYCKGSWNDFWEEQYYPDEYEGSTVGSVNLEEVDKIREEGGYDWTPPVDEEKSKYYYDYTRNDPNRKNPFVDKVVKWSLPVEADPSGEYFVTFPDDLLEAANLKEGDQVEWVDKGDGSYLLRKI
jgi:hypothetical protein